VDVLQRARELYAAGRMHDALEAAQSACERQPKDAAAWWLLACISRYTGLPAASDAAFRRAAGLARERALPHRVSPDSFQGLVDGALAKLSPDARRRLGRTSIRVEALPSPELVAGGTDPDALLLRSRSPEDVLTLYQVNHENRAGSERALRALVLRTLSRA